MSVPTSPCPNCGASWSPSAAVCPDCGYIRPAVPAWPPPPAGLAAVPLPPGPKLVTGAAWGDVTLGLGIGLGSNLFYGIGLILSPILYFVLRRSFPVFARGLGYGFLASLALLLGALAWCLAALSGYHGG